MSKQELVDRLHYLASKRFVVFRIIRLRRLFTRIEALKVE